ncbi:phage tail protein [Rhizobium rhizogenes]|uniref:Phage tail protein n=1 Tax=Rhizobium rhizogenes TaxID=359 RepID=A0AA88EYI0_RHIRH|nr:D-alanyl-D-alanine carboxypeptidase family protein [Rhizobium rhizogenes]KAA3500805.1 phage tail protein [Rhizobium rhizogenes]
MATEEERLVIALEARIRDFERNFQKANRTANDNFTAMERRAKQSADRMENSLSSVGKGLQLAMTGLKAGLAGLAAGGALAALAGIQSAVKDSTRSILEMSDSAKIAGVSFKRFQELKFVADQNRVSVDALTDGLKELSLRADEFIQTGSGSGAEAFQRLGYDAEDLAKKLEDPSALFLEIIGRLGQLDKAAQIRIADEIFGGTGGEVFVKLIEQGEQGIRNTIKAANDLGIVMDDELVAKADEVNRKFDALTTTIGTNLKAAIVDAVGALSDFIDRYRNFTDQKNTTLQSRQAELGMKRLELENQSLGLGNQQDRNAVRARAVIENELTKIAAEEAQIVNELNKRVKAIAPTSNWTPPTAPAGGFGAVKSGGKADLLQFLAPGKDAAHVTGMNSAFRSNLEKMFAAIPKELAGQISINSGWRSVERQQQIWQAALEKYGSVAEARKWAAPPGKSQHNDGEAADLGYKSDAARQWAQANASKFGLTFPLANENWHIEDQNARGKIAADRTKELEQLGNAYDSIISQGKMFASSQQLDAQSLGMTTQAAAALRYEQEMLNEAQRAGIALSPQQRAEIAQLAQGMAAAEDATNRLAKSQEDAKETANFFAQGVSDALTGLIMGTQTAEQALQGLLAMLAKAALQAAFLGEGPLANIFGMSGSGGLIGGLFSGLLGAKDGGEIQAFASGGRVRGPGGSREDKVPAWLSDGEHVINAKDASKNRSILEAINSGQTPALPTVNVGSLGTSTAKAGDINFGNISVNVSTQGSSGNAAMDDQNAKKIGKQVSESVRQEMTSFLNDQMRPGGMLWGR